MPRIDRSVPELSRAEVKHLWWFLDGAIMAPDVRRQLWRSWGFCSRHTWAHAQIESELRLHPFSTSILYENLITRAENAIRAPSISPASRRRRLQGNGKCFTCDFVTTTRSDDARFEQDRRVANRRATTIALLAESEDIWRRRSCPLCLRGQGPVCRPHILEGAEPPVRPLAEALGDISARLRVFIKSMTWRGPTPTAEHKVSWIEALGWFAGWDYPDRVLPSGR